MKNSKRFSQLCKDTPNPLMLVAGSRNFFCALWPLVFPPTTDVMQQTAHQLIAASLHPVQMALPASADKCFCVRRETPLFIPAAVWRLEHSKLFSGHEDGPSLSLPVYLQMCCAPRILASKTRCYHPRQCQITFACSQISPLRSSEYYEMQKNSRQVPPTLPTACLKSYITFLPSPT